MGPMNEQTIEDIKYLLSFAPAQSPEQVTEGLMPMFYVTGTHEGDVGIASRIEEIRNRYDISIDDVEDIDEEDEFVL